MTNTIYKAIMTRTKLRNKFLGLKTRQESHITKKETFVFLLFEMQKNIFMRILIQILLQITENYGNKLNLFSQLKHPIVQR